MAKARRNAMDPAPWVAMRTEADGTQVYKGFLYKPNAEKWASKGKRRLRRRNVFAGPFSIGGEDYLGAGGEIEMPGGEFEGPDYARNNGLGMQGFARPNPLRKFFVQYRLFGERGMMSVEADSLLDAERVASLKFSAKLQPHLEILHVRGGGLVPKKNPPRTKRQRKKQGGRFTVYHADHGIKPAQMRFIQERLDATAPQGFFLKQINIPKRLGPVPNALYGPAAGDKAVRESKKVHYMDRSGRGWKDRMVDLPVRPWHYVQAIGMRDGNKFTLFTVYGGPLAERHPDDPTNPDPEGSRKFWSQHALSSQQWAKGNSFQTFPGEWQMAGGRTPAGGWESWREEERRKALARREHRCEACGKSFPLAKIDADMLPDETLCKPCSDERGEWLDEMSEKHGSGWYLENPRPVPWRGAKGQFSSAQRRFEGIQPYGRRNPLAHNNPSTERLDHPVELPGDAGPGQPQADDVRGRVGEGPGSGEAAWGQAR
jgi:hypothetical protein